MGVWVSPNGEVEVAVKTLKEGSGEEDRVKFLQEAAIMGQFKHPNVVEMYGVVTQGKPVSSVANACIAPSEKTDRIIRVLSDCTYVTHSTEQLPGISGMEQYSHMHMCSRN